MKKRRRFLRMARNIGTTALLPTICSGCTLNLFRKKKYLHLQNNRLKSIKNDFNGNLLKDGLFQNLYGESGSKNLWDILKWKFSTNPQQKIKDNEQYQVKVFKNKTIFEEKEDYICWLGHASFLIQIDGRKILTDPCLTCPPLIKRWTKLPFEIKEIKPDYILISHGHYDHLDFNTIKQFNNAIALTPLKMSKIIKNMNPSIITQEAGWYQQYDIDEKFEIFFMPSHHWHKRTINDTNEVLWGSFMIKSKKKTIYFAGDSGYSKHFQDIELIFNSIDIALMPIGAYSPRYFMKSNHMNPQDALKASQDLKAKQIIPMHFGTFDLSDEPRGEPEKKFREIGAKENISFLNIGEKKLLL